MRSLRVGAQIVRREVQVVVGSVAHHLVSGGRFRVLHRAHSLCLFPRALQFLLPAFVSFGKARGACFLLFSLPLLPLVFFP